MFVVDEEILMAERNAALRCARLSPTSRPDGK
jgi:hypothetical protein